MLTNESPKYLFGGPNPNYYPNSTFHELPNAVGELGEQRPRSDSSGSNMSNASSSSSTSRPQLGHVNRPGFRGPITAFEQHPVTAPVVANDISHFMDSMNHGNNDIPHINCSNNSGNTGMNPFSNRSVSYSGYGPCLSGNTSGSASPALRPIEVQHIQTENRESPTPNQQSYTYRIQIHPNNGDTGVPSHGWMYHPVSMQQQNVIFPSTSQDILPNSQHQQYIHAGATSPYQSPGEDQPGYANYAQGVYGPPHASQTTIFLTNPTAPNASQQFSTIPRTLQSSPLQPHYNPGSLTDLRLSPNPNVNWNNNSPQTSQVSPQANPRPVVFEIPQRSGGVQSQIQYFDSIARTTNSQGGGGQQTPQSTFIGHMSPQTENPVPDPLKRNFQPERPSVINIHGAIGNQDSEFLKFPLMQNVCQVPAHQLGPNVQKSHSVDSPESVFAPEKDYQRHIPSASQPPFMSPASSPSSLSSGSSAQQTNNERQRSGSVDDPAYMQGKELNIISVTSMVNMLIK